MAREVQEHEVVQPCLAQQLLDALTDRPMGLVAERSDLEGANLRIAEDCGKRFGIVGRSPQGVEPSVVVFVDRDDQGETPTWHPCHARGADELRDEPVLLVA